MRRAFSLLALGITLALTAAEPAEPVLILSSIKAVDVDRANKDQWSAKGYIYDPDGLFVSAPPDAGMFAALEDGNDDFVNGVDFDAADCNALKNDRGIVCKTAGARVTAKRTNKVPKGVMIESQRNRNTTTMSSFYRLSAVFRRQEFNNTLSSPLTAIFGISGVGEIEDSVSNCNEREGARATKFLCTPSASP
ncbi:hypothetical protein VYU27_009247 [Nannochloropsis oceanica]